MKATIFIIFLLLTCCCVQEKEVEPFVIDTVDMGEYKANPFTWLIDSTVTPPEWEVIIDSVEVYSCKCFYKYNLYVWVKYDKCEFDTFFGRE